MLFVRLMGIVPLGIGLTVLGFMWIGASDGFGSPPLFFRIFASFIALPFVMIGAALLSGKLLDPQRMRARLQQMKQQTTPHSHGTPDSSNSGYTCPSCAAPLATAADVSPHGDVKCSHCDRWFNIHGRTSA